MYLDARPAESTGSAEAGVTIELADAARLVEVSAAWRDLVGRAAEPNVFMEPAVVRAMARADDRRRVCVLAWSGAEARSERRLVGLLTLAVGKPLSRIPMRVLRAPADDLAFLGTPVIDADLPTPVIAAMLDAIAADPLLPKILTVTDMTQGPVMDALRHALQARGSAPVILRGTERPILHSDLDGKTYLSRSLSSGTRKKLRQHRRRLEKQGVVETVTYSSPAEVRAAMEEFLTLEASGWKGRRGTALLSDDRAAAFTRDFIGGLAEDGLASIWSLRCNKRPLAMQVLLRSGTGAFTWKVTYDESFRDFSPGILLLEDLTSALLDDPDVGFVDSCAYDDQGYMADFWSQRRGTAEFMIDVRRGRSLAFTLLATWERNYRRMRETAKAGYGQVKPRLQRLQSRLGRRG